MWHEYHRHQLNSPQRIYQAAHMIRLTEQLLLDLFSQGLLSGTTHTCIGQELCQLAVVRALHHEQDFVLSTHRNHGHYLTYSGDVLGLLCEVMGRQHGVCQGVAGSQHIATQQFHANGVQGGMTAIGVGLALARQLTHSQAIGAIIVGDGTTGQGLLYESLNLASVWQVPVLFVIENNHIAQTTQTATTIGGEILSRGEAFGLDSWVVCDDDENFITTVETIVDRVRAQRRPGFLVIETQRLGPHSKGDDTRSAQCIDQLQQHDVLAAYGKQIPLKARQALQAQNHQTLQDYLQQAKQQPLATALPKHVHQPIRVSASVTDTESLTVRQTINQTLHHALTDDPKVLLLGEDLHDPYGGAFKVTQGLSTQYPDRVRSTPISEAAITGCAIGLAKAGFKPILEVMFGDFMTLTMDQLYNHACKFTGLITDKPLPLMIRTAVGGYRGYGPTHSQSPEHWLVTIPGLTVIYPSHRHDYKTCLQQALHWQTPLVWLEHKLLYGETVTSQAYQALDESYFPCMVRPSQGEPDLLLLTYGGILPLVEQAAQQLTEQEELQCEICVLAQLSPLPKQSLLDYIQQRDVPLLIIEETYQDFAIGAEIIASLAEANISRKVKRIATASAVIPAARSLEQQVLPSVDHIIDGVHQLFA